jgi:hypothetical protein
MAKNFYALIKGSTIVNTVVMDTPSHHDIDECVAAYDCDTAIICDAYVTPQYTWQNNEFVPPSPYPSWILDWGKHAWVAPVPQPDPVEGPDGKVYKIYKWDEETVSWVEDTPSE